MLITSSVSPPLSPALPSSAGHSHHNHFTSALQPPPPSDNVGGNGGVLPLSQPPNRGGTLTIFPPTSARLISHKYEDGLATANNSVLASNTVPVISRVVAGSAVTNPTESYHKSSGNKAPAVLLPPHPTPASSLPLRGSDNYADCVTLPPLTGHPREGQAASLLGGKYLLLEEIEGASLHRCLHIQSNQEFICKVKPVDSACQRLLTAHYRVDGHPNINTIQEVVIGRQRVYLVLPPCHGDLHSYVRSRRRLREATARALFRQVVAAVHHAHSRGIVLRDLKLRKFVFTDESRTELKLESLEDAVVLEDPQDDILSDKHGCPAYVSPEILKSNTQYSGRAADMWGLGVMLYTMLVGRYPFHGAEHSGLFAKIRRGQFSLPDHLSSRAKCLIRCLLKREPDERLTTEDVLVHPWLTGTHRERSGCSRQRPPHLDTTDHCVPEVSGSLNGVAGLGGAGAVDKYEAVFRSAASLAAASAVAPQTAATAAVPFSSSHPHYHGPPNGYTQ